jgi:uncharacterized protein
MYIKSQQHNLRCELEPTMPRPAQPFPFLLATLALGVLAAAAWPFGGAALSGMAVAGAFAGIALQRASFGFAGEWRAVITEGRTQGLRVQVVLIAVLGLVFMTLMAGGQYRGALATLGLPLVLGAFLFGIGMQISKACASGSLFSAGSGSIQSVFTIIGFVGGATIAAATYDEWSAWPALPTISLTHQFGTAGALAAHLAIAATVFGLAALYEKRRTGRVAGLLSDTATGFDWSRDRWPLWLGASGLGFAMLAIFLLNGRPWQLISAYPLIGSKLVAQAGGEPDFWGHWAANPEILERSLLADAGTLTDLGVIIGAALAAAFAGAFRIRGAWPPGPLALSLFGGIVMGFGARLAVGCNIGAFISGAASGSLHGWVFVALALAGTAAAVGTAALARRIIASLRAPRPAEDDSWKAARA